MKEIDKETKNNENFTQEIDNQNEVLKELIEKFSKKNIELTDSEKEQLDVFLAEK